MDDAALKNRIRNAVTDLSLRAEPDAFGEYRAHAERAAAARRAGRRRGRYALAVAAGIAVLLPAVWFALSRQSGTGTAGAGPAALTRAAESVPDTARLSAADISAYLASTAVITPTDRLGSSSASRLLSQTVTISYYDPINMELRP